MTENGRLPERPAAHLLTAAALLDLLAVYLLLSILGSVIRAGLLATMPEYGDWLNGLSPDLRVAFEIAVGVAAYLVLLLLYWLVCDLLLRGRSIGKFCLTLHPIQLDGRPPKAGQMWNRGLRKIGRLGLGGLSVTRVDSYDRSTGTAWSSPLAPKVRSAARGWRITVASGAYAGTSHTLERLKGFNAARVIRIGREAGWPDILLDRDDRVSNRHAEIRLHNGQWQIRDFGGGKGSTHKTRVGGKAIPPMRWVVINVPVTLHVADVELRLTRG